MPVVRREVVPERHLPPLADEHRSSFWRVAVKQCGDRRRIVAEIGEDGEELGVKERED
jgi:hypothetical protein